jgi:hypothetical protein
MLRYILQKMQNNKHGVNVKIWHDELLTYLLTNQLHVAKPLKKVIAAHLVKKLSTFYGL